MDEIYSNIRKAQNYLMFTPGMTNMKLLQLRKLTELSGYLNAKLYLIQNFIPNAKVIIANQTSDYAKDKIMNIIASICHIDKAIEMIGKDSEFVRIILRSFGTCNNIRLQITLFKFLQLIACEIQSNPESNWTLYLTNSSYFFAPNIIAILKKTKTVKVMLDGITMLHTLLDVKLANGASFLERLFNINELIDLLTQIQSFIQIEICSDCNCESKVVWVVMEQWISLLTIIRHSKSFIRAYSDFENDIQCLFLLYGIMSVQDMIFMKLKISTIEEYKTDGNRNNLNVDSTMDLLVPTFVKAMDLFLSFSVITTRYITTISNILDQIDCYIIEHLSHYETMVDVFRYHIAEIEENISPAMITFVQYTERYLRYFLPRAKCKQLLEEFMLLDDENRAIIVNSLREDVKNIHVIALKNLKKILRCCHYTLK